MLPEQYLNSDPIKAYYIFQVHIFEIINIVDHNILKTLKPKLTGY